MPKRNKSNGNAAQATNDRPVKYAELKFYHCDSADPLTADLARELLGWNDQDEVQGYDSCQWEYKEVVGGKEVTRKVWLDNNVTNRPVYRANVLSLMQEMLNRRWRFNGEPIIIGNTGMVLNGQHTLLGLVMADRERHGRQKPHWDSVWGDAPVGIEKLIVYGVDESDSTVNTMDTCKPRSLPDVLYRSEFFATLGSAERERAAALCDWAIRQLWERTGADADPWAPRRTHSEALHFLARHRRLLEAVDFLRQEAGTSNKALRELCPPGRAAAMMYLMAATATQPDSYYAADAPSEEQLDLSRWEDARAYWVALSAGDKKVRGVPLAIAALTNPHTGTPAGPDEKLAVVVKGWLRWRDGKRITEENVTPRYEETACKECASSPGKLGDGTDCPACHGTGQGHPDLAEQPSVGGIDLANPRRREDEEADTTPAPEAAAEEAPEAKEARRVDKRNELLERRRRQAETNAGHPVPTGVAPADARPAPQTFQEELERLREQHGDKLLLFRRGNHYVAWGNDAATVARVCKLTMKVQSGQQQALLPADADKLEAAISRLTQAGYPCELIDAPAHEPSTLVDQAEGAAGREQNAVEQAVADNGETPDGSPAPGPAATAAPKPSRRKAKNDPEAAARKARG
jgi:hypothetical protein